MIDFRAGSAGLDVRVPPPALRVEGLPRWPRGWERAAILFLVGFLLVFPKGGIKLAGVPITWGYLGLGLACLWLPLALIFRTPARVASTRLLTLALLVPFQLVICGALLANGALDSGFAISLLTAFFLVPAAVVLVWGIHLDRLNLSYLFRLLRLGILAIAAYGIFLFFYRLWTGSFIMIPYLTVNAGDLDVLEGKHIDRGGIFKLISTYNNGNIYGICLLLLLPLYGWLERSPMRQLIVKGSLVLTLSRTVWLGLLAYEILHRVYVRRTSLRAIATLLVWLALLAGGVAYALHLLEVNVSFLFDRQLGGRIGQLAVLADPHVLPAAAFTTIAEMVYLSVLENFGLLGLATFLLGMASPLFLHFAGVLPFSGTEYKRALVAGLAIYLLVALSDGAILYIPVMVFYWFVVSLLLSNNASFDSDGSVGGRARTT